MMDSYLYIHALEFANDKHKGQKRHNGESYIVHPIEVSLKYLEYENYETKIVALLHDTIEDTKTTEAELIEKFGYEIGSCVGLLTRDPMRLESYEEYIKRIKESKNPVATAVKIADLKHNLSTIENIPDLDKRKRLKERYERALSVLTG